VFGNVPRAGGSVSAVTVRELEPDGAVIDTVHGSGASDFIALDAQESGVVRGDLLPPPQSATVLRGESREVREDDDLMFGRDQDARDRERLNLERLLGRVCS